MSLLGRTPSSAHPATLPSAPELPSELPAPWAEILPLLDPSPALVAMFTGADHHLAFLNRALTALVGARALGRPAADLFADHPDYLLALDHVRGGGAPVTYERSPLTLGRAEGAGRTRLMTIVFSPVPGADGEVAAVLGQAVDVTEQSVDAERLRFALALDEMSLELSRSLEVGQVSATLTRLAAEVLGGWALLDLWQPDGSLARVAATHHDPAHQRDTDRLLSEPRISGRPAGQSEAYSARAARTGEVFLGGWEVAQVAAAASSPQHAELMERLRPRWFACIPVQVGPRRLGALSVVRPEGTAPFGPSERLVLEQFAERAAIALAHARDYDEQRQAALTLQRTLLPQAPSGRRDVEIAVRYQAGGAGSEVGGDWYDLVDLDGGVRGRPDGGPIGIVVGDVEGHDLPAAALMGQVRAIVHSHARAGLPPAQVAREANTFLVEAAVERLVTLSYLQLFPAERLVVAVRAGHMPVVVVAPDGTRRLLYGRGGLPLGVDAGERWQEQTIHLPPGALLAVVTDGLVETPQQGFEAGLDQLASILAANVHADVDVVADRVLAEMTGPDAGRDDRALVLVRLPPDDGDGERGQRVVARRLPAAPWAAPLLRRFSADVLAQWGVAQDVVEVSSLLVTELVSNATRHSDAAIELRMSWQPGRLQVSVFDDSHRLPQVQQVEPDETSGRGLALVDLLASRWGVRSEDRGKAVWFELRAPDAAHHPDQ